MNDKNYDEIFVTRIDTCALRIINKIPSDFRIGSHGYLVNHLTYMLLKWGKTRGASAVYATIREENLVRVALDDFGDSAFPASTICSTGLRAHSVRPHRYARYGVASYRCNAHGFHPRETLPSATRPCCGRRSCPVSRCPVFGYGTNCSLTVRKPIRGWAPSLTIRCRFPSSVTVPSAARGPSVSLTGSPKAH